MVQHNPGQLKVYIFIFILLRHLYDSIKLMNMYEEVPKNNRNSAAIGGAYVVRISPARRA